MKTGRKLKQEAFEPVAQQVRDKAEVLDQRAGAREALAVGNEFVDLDCVGKVAPCALPGPGPDGSYGWP